MLSVFCSATHLVGRLQATVKERVKGRIAVIDTHEVREGTIRLPQLGNKAALYLTPFDPNVLLYHGILAALTSVHDGLPPHIGAYAGSVQAFPIPHRPHITRAFAFPSTSNPS